MTDYKEIAKLASDAVVAAQRCNNLYESDYIGDKHDYAIARKRLLISIELIKEMLGEVK